MGRTLEKRNMYTFYIRDDYRSMWDEFLRLAKKDENFQRQRYKKRAGLISIAIINLIYDYILKKNPDFKLAQEENETPPQVDDKTA